MIQCDTKLHRHTLTHSDKIKKTTITNSVQLYKTVCVETFKGQKIRNKYLSCESIILSVVALNGSLGNIVQAFEKLKL